MSYQALMFQVYYIIHNKINHIQIESIPFYWINSLAPGRF